MVARADADGARRVERQRRAALRGDDEELEWGDLEGDWEEGGV